jgi:hypothetical protein
MMGLCAIGELAQRSKLRELAQRQAPQSQSRDAESRKLKRRYSGGGGGDGHDGLVGGARFRPAKGGDHAGGVLGRAPARQLALRASVPAIAIANTINDVLCLPTEPPTMATDSDGPLAPVFALTPPPSAIPLFTLLTMGLGATGDGKQMMQPIALWMVLQQAGPGGAENQPTHYWAFPTNPELFSNFQQQPVEEGEAFTWPSAGGCGLGWRLPGLIPICSFHWMLWKKMELLGVKKR